MSSMVCQGLQSCLEDNSVEPRALGLKMAATNSHFLKNIKWIESLRLSDNESDTEDCNDKNITKKDNANLDGDSGGWSFIQTLTSQSVFTEAKEEQQKAYVHPLYKTSVSQLCNKSLELCTEPLGSETGSDIGDDIDISFSSSDSESSRSPTKERSRLRNAFGSKKVNYRSLPPPLTSISGSNCYSIKPHREGGRLVMKAVPVPSPSSCFHAERSGGCLKLRYMKSYASLSSNSLKDQHKKQQVEHDGIEEDYFDEEMDGNNINDGGEIGMGRIQRLRRCNEGGRRNKGLSPWESLLVAT